MGLIVSKAIPNFFRLSRSSKQASSHRPGVCKRLTKPPDFPSLVSGCISAASNSARKYLAFRDPDEKFHPSPQVLTQVFLMTYVTESVELHITDTFSCTAMSPEQRVLLGADWVWTMMDKSTKKPKIQIAVQVLHLSKTAWSPPSMEWMDSGHQNMCEKMVEFCSAIGWDCYALFLFFGRTDDVENIYGVLSNNFTAAVRQCGSIDRALIENFFRGSRCFHSPLGMMTAVLRKTTPDPLTLVVKFS